MMRSIKNKRGEGETSGLSTIITLGLILAVAIIVGLFIWKVWGKFGATVDAQDPATISAVKGCELGIQTLKESGYCSQFKEVTIGRGKQWVNCQYMVNTLRLNVTGAEAYSTTCSDSAKLYCEQLNISEYANDAKWKEIVNGKLCDATGLAL